jgi:hypothetical protein
MSSNSAIFTIANFYAKLRQSVGEGAFFPRHPDKPPIYTSLPHGTSKPQGSFPCSNGFWPFGESLALSIHLDAPAVVRALSPNEPVILNRPQAAAR